MGPKPSRIQLIQWVNDVLQLNVALIDNLGTGAEYCQMFDSLFGDVPMHKVVFNSRSRLDWEANMKILQSVFMRHGIKRGVDTSGLMKCRLQDNLEFTQWLYVFWNEHPRLDNYDPIARRQANPQNTSIADASMANASILRPRRSSSALNNVSHVTPVMKASQILPPRGQNYNNQNIRPGQHSRSASGSSISTTNNNKADDSIRFLQAECAELERTVDVLVAERSFYYSKLRDVEDLVNHRLNDIYDAEGPNATMDAKDEPLVVFLRKVQDVLFATPEGFEVPADADEEPF